MQRSAFATTERISSRIRALIKTRLLSRRRTHARIFSFPWIILQIRSYRNFNESSLLSEFQLFFESVIVEKYNVHLFQRFELIDGGYRF